MTFEQDMSLAGFRAELDVFEGPLDLLLYLVKQQEVEISEISLGRITDRYLGFVRVMEGLDVNVAAEFLVVAATLMEIKSRALLPAGEPLEDEQQEDPGAELVRQLLEYKEFKEAADHLDRRAQQRGERFARPRQTIETDFEGEPEPAALLEDLATWDLMAAFARMMEQTSLTPTRHIIRSEVPVGVYIEEVLARLRSRPEPFEFLEFFTEQCTRQHVVGVFLALLELVKRRAVTVHQVGNDPTRLRVTLSAPLRLHEHPHGGS